VQGERGKRRHLIVSRGAQEVADDGDVGIEDLRAGCRSAVDGQRAAGASGALGPWRDLRRLHRGVRGRLWRCPTSRSAG
jgi:hypothetical protein